MGKKYLLGYIRIQKVDAGDGVMMDEPVIDSYLWAADGYPPKTIGVIYIEDGKCKVDGVDNSIADAIWTKNGGERTR